MQHFQDSLKLNDNFVIVGDHTDAAIKTAPRSETTLKVYRYIRNRWASNIKEDGNLFSLHPTNESIAECTGTGTEAVKKALASLEKLGVLIRIHYHDRDKRKKSLVGEKRRLLIPIDLKQDNRDEVLRECRTKALSPETHKGQKKLIALIDYLLPPVEVVELKKPSKRVQARYSNAFTMSQDDLETADDFLRIEDAKSDKIFKAIQAGIQRATTNNYSRCFVMADAKQKIDQPEESEETQQAHN